MIRKGLAVVVILLFIGVAFAIPITANVSKSSLEPVTDIEVLEKEDTPLKFKIQRIKDLVRSLNLRKVIVNPDAVVDTLEEISTILEEEDVRNYIEKSSEEDCGCDEEASEFEWFFPVICTLLVPFLFVAALIFFASNHMFRLFADIMFQIGEDLNCYWTGGSPWSK